PFAPAPRPLWPWRPVFGREASERAWARARGAGELLLPESAAASGPAELIVRAYDRGREQVELAADERLFLPDDPQAPREDPPWIEIEDGAPGDAYEIVLATELGYEPAHWSPAPDARSERGVRCSLREALIAPIGGGGLLLHQVLAQSADLGAQRAWL